MNSKQLRRRPASESDFEWLLELRLATMGEHFDASGQVLSSEEHAGRVKQEYSAIEVIQVDGSDVGMIKVIREPEVWHLVQIQLLPEHQRMNIGTMIIRRLLRDANEASVPVSLHVLKVNPAKRLYERLGFNVVEDLGHSYHMRSDA